MDLGKGKNSWRLRDANQHGWNGGRCSKRNSKRGINLIVPLVGFVKSNKQPLVINVACRDKTQPFLLKIHVGTMVPLHRNWNSVATLSAPAIISLIRLKIMLRPTFWEITMNCTKFNTLKSRVSKRNTREFIYSSSNLLVIILTLVHRSCVLGAVIDSFRSIGDRHRAWDKGPTAEVESSHGQVNPTNSRVK